MSTKRMFFRIALSELVFFGICILLFIFHLAIWLDEKGIAENVFNLYLPPSKIPIYILLMLYFIVFIYFSFLLSKQIKKLQESNFHNCRKAFHLTLAGHLLAFVTSAFLVFARDPNIMATVIPGIFSLYFAIMVLILVILYFNLFVRRTSSS